MSSIITKFFADQSGATAIEYALIAAGIAMAIITIVNTLGGTVGGMLTTINTALTP